MKLSFLIKPHLAIAKLAEGIACQEFEFFFIGAIFQVDTMKQSSIVRFIESNGSFKTHG